MRLTSSTFVAATAGLTATAIAFFSAGAGAQGQDVQIRTVDTTETAIFAGGCFWCVESDFDKFDGVLETISGYTGGKGANPTYKTHGKLGHYEAVQVSYDASQVSYDELVEYFFRHIDPTDANGQFCDKGPSYRTAVFVLDERQEDVARNAVDTIEASGVLGAPVVTRIRPAGDFYPAEDYHQDYYLKQPQRYKFYRQACGRDQRLTALWGETPAS